MTTVPIPICYSCQHLYDLTLDQPMACDAYPNGIPEPILESEVDHRLPYIGDGGIRFVQNPDRPPPNLLAFEGEPP